MYGLVNIAVRDLVRTVAGDDAWQAIAAKAQCNDVIFEAMSTYPDEVTYRLVGAASEVLKMPADDVLRAFGRYWILFTANEGYGDLMNMFGSDMQTCLRNLNNMHGRMGAMMPALVPPRFVLVQSSADEFRLEYHSTRKGLAPMVQGLLEGLAEKFGESMDVRMEDAGAGPATRVFVVTRKK